jgi:hypothetical protein
MIMPQDTFKIYLPYQVRGDWPIGHHLVAPRGIHNAVSNPNGAVSVVLPSGDLLGVKPNEFLHVCKRCECQIDEDGCGCNPEGA